MINDYSDPKVTLKQQYAAVTQGTSATLGVCVIGPNIKTLYSYKQYGNQLKIADSISKNGLVAAALSATNLPTVITNNLASVVDARGVSVYGRGVSICYQLYTSSSTQAPYSHPALFKATVSKMQGQDGMYKVYVQYQASAGVGGSYAVFTGSAKDSITPVAGDQLQCIGSSVTNAFTVVRVGSDSTGQYIQARYTGTGTVSESTTYNTVVLRRTLQDAYIAKSALTVNVTNDTVSIAAGSRVQAVSLQGETAFAYPIVQITQGLYVQYSGVDQKLVGKLGVIAATTDAEVQEVLGQISPQNPLACAVACACAAADSNYVYYVAIDYTQAVSDSTSSVELLQAYAQAMDLIIDNDAIHGIVPCTTNKPVLRNLLSRATTAADQQIPHFKYIYASVAVPQVTVDNNHHAVANSIVQTKAFSNKRGLITFADGPRHNGVQVPSYCVAAAVAGLRSASYPHAPLSNVVLPGIQTTDASGFTSSDLTWLGANGFLRVGQNVDGLTIIRRQLTSAAKGDVNYDEQSIVCNIDSICLNIKNSGKGYIGNTNISQELLSLLQVELQDRLRGFSLYVDSLIGPQLLSWQIVNLAQHPVYKDRIYVTIQGQPPKPFNRFDITFRMI